MKRGISIVLFVLSSSGATLGSGQEAGPMERKLEALEEAARLQPRRLVRFLESRHFPFRKDPVEVEGVMRVWQGRGINILYPEKRVAILADEAGVLFRKYSKDGSFRQREGRTGDSEAIDLMRAAFQFDSESLKRSFAMSWSETGEQWSIEMAPLSEAASKVKSLLLVGAALEIERIEMTFDGDRKVVVIPQEETIVERFSEEEVALYFRKVSAQ